MESQWFSNVNSEEDMNVHGELFQRFISSGTNGVLVACQKEMGASFFSPCFGVFIGYVYNEWAIEYNIGLLFSFLFFQIFNLCV